MKEVCLTDTLSEGGVALYSLQAYRFIAYKYSRLSSRLLKHLVKHGVH
jgi:hypothetical protein